MPKSNIGNQFDDFNVGFTHFLHCQNDYMNLIEELPTFV